MKRSVLSVPAAYARRGLSLLAVLALAAVLPACEDDPSEPDDDLQGTFVVDTGEGQLFVRITEDEIHVFEENGACYTREDFDIVEIAVDEFSLQDPTGAAVTWTITEGDDEITIAGMGDADVTLAETSANVNSLVTCLPDADFFTPPCAVLPQVTLDGLGVIGTIEPGDARWSDNTWYDLYRLNIATPTAVSIKMEAADQGVVDAYLQIYDATGTVELEEIDDIAVDDFDARAQLVLQPGCYIIVAGSYSEVPADAGDYTVTASTTLESEFPHDVCTAIPEVEVGGSVVGLIDDTDPVWRTGDFYELRSLQLGATTDVTISLSGTGGGLDPVLYVYNSAGSLLLHFNDDIDFDAGNYDSQVEATLGAGCYIIVARTYFDTAGEAGTYSLEVTSP